MNRRYLIVLFSTAMMILCSQAVYGIGPGAPGAPIGPQIISGGGPSFWDHNSQWHSQALKDYYSQLQSCQLFYDNTAGLRKQYYIARSEHNEQVNQGTVSDAGTAQNQLADLQNQIEQKQPPRFSCPW